MSEALITTKLSVPPLRRKLVHRPYLLDKLSQGSESGFILISAPAGYGKTTLLSAWIAKIDYDYAWLSLDPADNDLARFLRYLATALGQVDISYSEAIISSFFIKSPMDLEKLLTLLINQLALRKQKLCLVLDDYHVIHDQSIHRVITFLLKHRPSPLKLIIATRTDPPIALNSLRAHSQICELRLADLKFTNVETQEFLNQVMDLNLSKEDVMMLNASTEGWVAGLQMAGLSAQNREDISTYIRSFSGGNRYILDFLFEEIFSRQTKEIQNFLLKTSILERISSSLCNYILMRQDSQSHLEFLEHGNLFLTALDEQHEWYRYHNLFQLLLQQQLQKRHSKLIPSLHLRASEWYEQMRRFPQAIHHGFKSQDLDRSAQLIERAADATLLNGEVNTFLNWVENLPEDICCQWPLLCVYHAEALLLAGKSMSHITQRLEDTNEITAIEALKASYQGNVNLSKKLSAQALENLPKYSVFLRSVIISSLGAVLLLSGDIDLAIETFLESAAINKESHNLMFEIIALSRLGQLYKIAGKIEKAEIVTQQALDLSTFHSGDYIPAASMPLMALANLKYEQNDLEYARSLIEKAIKLSEESGGFWVIDCYLVSAFILLGIGENESARKVMVKAREISSQTEANLFDDIYSAAYEAQFNLMQGDLDEAIRWSSRVIPIGVGKNESISTRYSSDLFHLTELEQLTLAKVFVSQNKPDKAVNLLRTLYCESEQRGRKISMVENLILQAIAYQELGKPTEALTILVTSLKMAEAIGYCRVFLNAGTPLKSMLTNLTTIWNKNMNIENNQISYLKPYIHDLLLAFDREPSKTQMTKIVLTKPKQDENLSWIIEPLSKRECEVVVLLSKGCSNKDIAQNLMISSGTVHKHLNNIFSKLGVHNRTSAVARARDLGYL